MTARYEDIANRTPDRQAALDAEDARYLAKLAGATRTSEETRLAAHRAAERALQPGEELVYPDGVDVPTIVRDGIVPTKRRRAEPVDPKADVEPAKEGAR